MHSYCPLGLKESLTVAFVATPTPSLESKLAKTPSAAVVSFDPTLGYERFRVQYHDKSEDGSEVHTFFVPRNGVTQIWDGDECVSIQSWVPPTPTEVWVQMGIGKIFPVSPTVNSVASLRHAVKASRPNALKDVDADALTVKNPDGTAPKLTDVLVANTEATPYTIEAPAVVPPTPTEVWVKMGIDKFFSVAPTVNSIDSLRDAVKAKRSNALKDVDADALTVKGPDGGVLEVDDRLVANTKVTAYVVEVTR